MQQITITIVNIPDGTLATIWEASIEIAPKILRRQITTQPAPTLEINYAMLPGTSKQETCLSLTGLICTHLIEQLEKGGK